MGNKYYIPDLQDLRVGFECEIMYKGAYYPIEAFKGNLPWMYNSNLRVPYLTEEQIVAEGFEIDILPNGYRFSKQGQLLTYDLTNQHNLTIVRDYNDIDHTLEAIYQGTCRCINDFRLICKLLNIK